MTDLLEQRTNDENEYGVEDDDDDVDSGESVLWVVWCSAGSWEKSLKWGKKATGSGKLRSTCLSWFARRQWLCRG